MHICNITQTEKVICRNIYVYTYMHETMISEKSGKEFKRELGEGLQGRKGKRDDAMML